MKLLKFIFKIIGLFIAVVLVSNWLSFTFIDLYEFFTGNSGKGSWLNLSSILGLLLAYPFFVALIFTIFEKRYRYWIIGLLTLPLFLFELSSGDFKFFSFSVLLALIGWALGFGLRFGFNKVLSKRREL